jgi:hypothetical protein
MKHALQLRSAAPQRPPVLPVSEENLCNAIPALVETTAPSALLDNAAQLLGYATAPAPRQTYTFVIFKVDIGAALLTKRPRPK